MPLHKLTESELRNNCKHYLETLEHWLRRLVDDELRRKYGDKYYESQDSSQNYILNKSIRESVSKRLQSEPTRYSKWVNATLLDDLITIICHPQLYSHFKDALKQAFPEGNNEARTFLERLIQPRNHLSHTNPISVHQAEQVICYVNDVIDSIKQYYNEKNMDKEYNVPSFIRIWDSFGNQEEVIQEKQIFDFARNPKNYMRPGDILSIEVEIDSSFAQHEYNIIWTKGFLLSNSIAQDTCKIDIPIGIKDVGEQFSLTCYIITKNQWHKYRHYDDEIEFCYKILPPLEE